MHPLIIPNVSIERILKAITVITLGIMFVAYAGYQARNLIQGPKIDLMGELGTVRTERAVTLVGSARNVVVLRLNGQEIHTDEFGKFEHTLTLESGYTIMKLEAEDRYGRRTELIRSFIYKPTT